MAYEQNNKEIVKLLKCLECGGFDLTIKKGMRSDWSGYAFRSAGWCIVCENCGSEYPITEDGIPILWTSQLKQIFRGTGAFDIKDGALSANISHYDRISDNYSANFRRDSSHANRIRRGAARLLASPRDSRPFPRENGYHLDIGCGPGHVLEWLKGITNRQIGLDVSLANLRNARKSTGAYVVLGDATAMPFRDDSFLLVTESSVLHHIFDWEKVILESCRVCSKANGGILYDSEPTVESLSLSLLARLVFEMRWPIYKGLSYLDAHKIHFRNIALARDYYQSAEIHNQPGRGFVVQEVEGTFRGYDFTTEKFLSPSENLEMRQTIPWNEAGWKRIILHLLSGHNPLLSKYGSFTLLAYPIERN